MVERDRDAAVGILNVEDYGVAPNFTPMLDHADAVIAAGHESGEVDSADFEIFRDGDRLLGDRSGNDARDDDLFVVLENVRAIQLVIDGTDRLGQLRRREVRRPAEITVGDRGNGFSA